MTAPGFRSPDVCRLTGATFRQVDYWTRNGWIGPTIAAGVGSGWPRVWSLDDLVHVAAMVELCRCGIYPSVAARILSGDLGGPYVRISVDLELVRRMVFQRTEADVA